MLCDNCKNNPATVHLTEIVDEQMTELHLCEECAKKKSSQMEQQFGLSDLLAGLADFEKPVEDKDAVSIQCPNCGLTYKDFKKIGRLGCSECYDTFKKFLSPLLKRIHGSSVHCGKCPVKAGRPSKKELDLVDLRLKLQKAVEAEEYEEAAKLRDRIKQVQDKKAQAEDKGPEK